MIYGYAIRMKLLRSSLVLNTRKSGDIRSRLGNTGYRVTMIPCDDTERELTEGDILAKCKMIKIIKVTEVSNHYE